MTYVSTDRSSAVIGVGIDTARYGHHVTFLREDRQPAAPPLQVLESRAGYEELGQALQGLSQRYPGVHFHVRIDAAGQYADNLERFLRSLPWPMTLSVGEPARNRSYRHAHFPKRKADVTDSLGNARYAVVEQPGPTPDLPPEFQTLREVASQLESQVCHTTRLVNQLHNRLARVFPELATLARNLARQWLLKLLTKYPTPEKIARARLDSLTTIPYLTPRKAELIQAAAKASIGSLRGPVAEALIRQQVAALRQSLEAEAQLEELLRQAYQALPPSPHQQLQTVPGIGPATAAALVAKVVSIDRFATPAQLVGYFGVFPEERSSGTDRSGNLKLPRNRKMSRQGNDLVRKYLWSAAMTAILHNPAVRALYLRQRARGKRGDVALGHCMRKLLHLVFAVWKTGKPFDPQHYPWDRPPTAEGQKKAAAGHNPAPELVEKVVTATPSNVGPMPPTRKLPTAKARAVDFAYLREQVSMERVLQHLGHLGKLHGFALQRRGPCPLHGADEKPRRSFSVHLGKNVFRCFHPACAAQGNVLDLWAAMHHLPLYDAAVHLAETFHLHTTRNREEEPVFKPQHDSNPVTHSSSPPEDPSATAKNCFGVITLDAS